MNKHLPICSFSKDMSCNYLTTGEQNFAYSSTSFLSLYYPIWGSYTNSVSYFRRNFVSDGLNKVRRSNSQKFCEKYNDCIFYLENLVKDGENEKFKSEAVKLYLSNDHQERRCESLSTLKDLTKQVFGPKKERESFMFLQDMYRKDVGHCRFAFIGLGRHFVRNNDYTKLNTLVSSYSQNYPYYRKLLLTSIINKMKNSEGSRSVVGGHVLSTSIRKICSEIKQGGDKHKGCP